MMTRQQILEQSRGGYLICRGAGGDGMRFLHYFGYWPERIDGVTHLMRRDFPPGTHMAVAKPPWPRGLEHAVSAVC